MYTEQYGEYAYWCEGVKGLGGKEEEDHVYCSLWQFEISTICKADITCTHM